MLLISIFYFDRHLQQIWGASGNFWQAWWTRCLDLFGNDEFLVVTLGTTIVGFVVYFGVGSIYIFLDTTTWPKWVRKYKVQPGTNEPVDNVRLMQVAEK